MASLNLSGKPGHDHSALSSVPVLNKLASWSSEYVVLMGFLQLY